LKGKSEMPRVIKSGEYMLNRAMISGTTEVSMNSSTSKVFSPMRNTDIKRAVETGDWTELMERASKETNRFRRNFYA